MKATTKKYLERLYEPITITLTRADWGHIETALLLSRGRYLEMAYDTESPDVTREGAQMCYDKMKSIRNNIMELTRD